MARLAGEQWTAVSQHAMVLPFLRAEWDRWPVTRWIDRRLVDEADLTDRVANRLRKGVLFMARGRLFQSIPTDTKWFEVQNLRDEHLQELRVIGRCGWEHPSDRNELRKVALRRDKPLKLPPAQWDAPVLWGHTMEGPFTILEGNNRLASYAGDAAHAGTLDLPCIIGLSAQPCYWHLADPFEAKS